MNPKVVPSCVLLEFRSQAYYDIAKIPVPDFSCLTIRASNKSESHERFSRSPFPLTSAAASCDVPSTQYRRPLTWSSRSKPRKHPVETTFWRHRFPGSYLLVMLFPKVHSPWWKAQLVSIAVRVVKLSKRRYSKCSSCAIREPMLSCWYVWNLSVLEGMAK